MVLYEVATHDPDLAVPLIFSLTIVGAGFYNPSITGFRATGNINLEVTCEIVSRAVVLIGGGLWLLAGGGIMAVAIAYSGVGLAVGLVAYGFVRIKSVTEALGAPRPSLSLRAAAPFVLASTVGAVLAMFARATASLSPAAHAASISDGVRILSAECRRRVLWNRM